MPFQYQLIDAKNSDELKSISANCSSTDDFRSKLNQVIRRLMKRGDWYGTEQIVEFCTNGCNVTWPRWVGTVEAVRFGRGHAGHVFNNWYRFIGPHHHHGDFHSDVVLSDAGTAPTYNDITGTTGRLLRYNVVKAHDIGKKITIYGKQYGNQPLQEQDPPTGNWIAGMTLTAANPYGTNTTLVTEISAITREATEGMAYLYEYDPVTGTVIDLAQFEPNETNPRYRRSCITNQGHGHCHTDANGIRWTKVEALIKLEFIPLVNDRDFLIVDDLDALKLGIQAIQLEESNDDQLAEAKWLKAIRELNFRDRDKFPDQTTPVKVMAMSGHRIRSLS